MQKPEAFDAYDSSFKNFISKNGIIATAAGITIGFATATFFKSFVADMILPVFFMLLVKGTGKVSRSTGSFFGQFLSNKEFRFTNFVSELITWLLIILVAWLVINAINKYVMGKASLKTSLQNMNPFNHAEREAKEHEARAASAAHGTFQETSAEAFMQQQKMQNAWNAEMYVNGASAQPMHELPRKIVHQETNAPSSHVPEGFVEASTSGSGAGGRGCSRELAPF